MVPTSFSIDTSGLAALIALLQEKGYQVMGPVQREEVIRYAPVTDIADLPRGWQDHQEAGHYRLEHTPRETLFAYNLGQDSWKQYLFPPRETLLVAKLDEHGLSFHPPADPAPKLAFLGMRSCELQAIAVQDRVFMQGDHHDPGYSRRRRECLFIAVQCGQAGNTCFCTSMDTGPKAEQGFDLALTEVSDHGGHRFLVEVGSERGRDLLQALPHQPADSALQDAAREAWQQAVSQMGRHLDTKGLKEDLESNLEQPGWQLPADRCLSCGNCTLVCPTCFCSTVEEQPSMDGSSSETVRHWASCFEDEFSYIAGGSIRRSTKSRYRQWLTHKLASWHDQFGSSGCVGCGRCISWCPVGIDITAEAQALRQGNQEGSA